MFNSESEPPLAHNELRFPTKGIGVDSLKGGKYSKEKELYSLNVTHTII